MGNWGEITLLIGGITHGIHAPCSMDVDQGYGGGIFL